jgi:hypothetical protein
VGTAPVAAYDGLCRPSWHHKSTASPERDDEPDTEAGLRYSSSVSGMRFPATSLTHLEAVSALPLASRKAFQLPHQADRPP